ncbi:IS861 transposase [Streptococcus sanguinis SK1087]|uniref:IS861 transposase n=1 Tax=Streptococcus sanguinis SK1087 TaxID=888824 RepID=F3SJB1_STRSA|nr:IS861 transposase [Streptococcus sanguinis SK1087]
MKLTYEDKVRIYELRKQGISLKRLSEKYGMNLSKLLTSQTSFYIFAYYSTNHKEKSASFD